MYKRLLASTALIAAGMVGASAAVQAQTAPAAQPLQVTVGGYFENTFGYAGNDDGVVVNQRGTATGTANAPFNSASATTLSEPNKWGQQYDSEIWFNVKGTLANGISVGARVELEANTESDTIDESYFIIEGAFGRIDLGATNAAANKMAVSVPAIGKAHKADSMFAIKPWIVAPTAVSTIDDDQTAPELTGDNQTLSYYTPRFAGFQLGASFVPNNRQDLEEFGDERDERVNFWSLGANFTRAFGGLNVEASLGWEHAESVDGATSNAAADDVDHYAVGLRLGYAGFSLGGGYKKADEGDFSTTDGDVWSVGLSYTFGPATVGIQYLKAEVEGTTTTAASGDDKAEVILLGANYTLGPGVDLFGNIFGIEWEDESATDAASNNKGTAAIVGLRLTF
jgi:predicted porin